ncbi:cation transporter [Intrasporangium oryzae NRRL B-24470]|uniref:Cation transporter n=1 Tax=Intrasporangium oryzae NRRL B-24470 TaxID=1386089 RepID=W9G512_9MICO|nr:cation:proton antiporter [Intrasporangium oryzae]EWT01236.1 cation transporter [Intrasporangium oryzae NRRL B-24470]
MSINAVYLIAGIALLLAAVLPVALERYAISAPMVLLTMGMGIGLLPMPDGLHLDPVELRPQIQRFTELTVLVALMGVGLALDRPFRLRDRTSWAAWSPTWRLLALAMPLTIAGIALLGWGLGLAPAVALLLGSILSPTDPVLAGDVQVGGPQVRDEAEQGRAIEDLAAEDAEIDEHDDVRFALTSEAGLNDGLAFPFVYAALFLATLGPASSWLGGWLAWELVGKIAVGIAVGAAVGWALARVAFGSSSRPLQLAEQGEPLLALAALVMTYGLSELLGGYGFLAVFACGMTIRGAERGHHYHGAMHEVIERLERLLTLVVLLLLGMAMTKGLLADLDWRSALIVAALIVVVRPVAGWLSLVARRRDARLPGGLRRSEALAVAFFGVRGVGSLYYLAYAAGQHAFAEERWLWSTVALAIVTSVFVHGVLATPVLRRLDARREARES